MSDCKWIAVYSQFNTEYPIKYFVYKLIQSNVQLKKKEKLNGK